MTERTMSPTAAQAHARKAVRARFKILRTDGRPVAQIKVDSPRVFADRLVSLLKDAAYDNPGPWSEEWAEHVLRHAGQQYERLCEVAPIREPAGAR